MFTVNRSMRGARPGTASTLAWGGMTFAGAVLGAVVGLHEAPAADFSDLAARVRDAAAQPPAVSAALLDEAASDLRHAIAKARAAGGDHDQDKDDGIDWKALESQAADGSKADLAVIRGLERAVQSRSKGFAPPARRPLATAIGRYARVVEASKQAASDSPARKPLESLGRLLDEAAKNGPTVGGGFGDLESAGPLLGTLEDLRAAPAITADVRRAVGLPNVFVDVHESLLSTAVNRPVDEVAPVDEVILGIRQRGTGHTQGFVRLDLVPSEDRAVMDLVLAATNHSNTRGGQGPVTVCSRGTTDLGARRRILLEEERAYGLFPEAHASARSQTEGVGVRAHLGRNIIRNVAMRRAASMRPQADAIVAGRARERLLHRFDDQTREGVDGISSNYQTMFREPLMVQGLYPEMLHHNTTDAALHSVARKMLPGQVGAATPPPPSVERAVLSARLHQTAITNAASVWLAGRTITKEQVEEEYRRRGWTLPDVFAKGVEDDDQDKNEEEEQKPWSVRFASPRPLDLVVGEDRVTATLHGETFTSGDRTVGPMDIKAAYRIESSSSGTRLVRDGDIEIAPPGGKWKGGDKPGLDERVIRRRLRKRVERVLAESIDVGPLPLRGQLEPAGPLPIERLSSRKDGWIAAGWRAKDTAFPVGIPVGEPGPVAPSESQEVIGPGIETSASRSSSLPIPDRGRIR